MTFYNIASLALARWQCEVVERFLSLFGDKARYFNNGVFANNSSDGFPLVPPGAC
jgi:hypothetical protein